MTTVAKEISVEDAQKRGYYTVGELKKMLESLDEEMLVAIHRVEDDYFKKDGENGWAAIKATWGKHPVGDRKQEYESYLKEETTDLTLSEIKEENGVDYFIDYIDAIPAFQAFVAKEKKIEGKKILIITPHY